MIGPFPIPEVAISWLRRNHYFCRSLRGHQWTHWFKPDFSYTDESGEITDDKDIIEHGRIGSHAIIQQLEDGKYYIQFQNPQLREMTINDLSNEMKHARKEGNKNNEYTIMLELKRRRKLYQKQGKKWPGIRRKT